MSPEEQGSRRLAETLHRRLAAAGVSMDELGQRLGWAEGALTEALSGAVELKVKDLLALLQAAGIEERSFFAELYDLEPRYCATSGQGEIPYSIGHLSEEDLADFPPTEEVLALFRSLVHDSVRQESREEESGRPGASSPFDEADLLGGRRRGD
jgi:transcriptional regulator with XRE-family HTH domain